MAEEKKKPAVAKKPTVTTKSKSTKSSTTKKAKVKKEVPAKKAVIKKAESKKGAPAKKAAAKKDDKKKRTYMYIIYFRKITSGPPAGRHHAVAPTRDVHRRRALASGGWPCLGQRHGQGRPTPIPARLFCLRFSLLL